MSVEVLPIEDARMIRVGDVIGCRTVEKIGYSKRFRYAVRMLRCNNCGILTKCTAATPPGACQLCLRNAKRDNVAKYRAHK